MRTQQCIRGLNNSQQIRVMVDGFGFYTTVQGAMMICTTKHRIAVERALNTIANEKIRAFGSNNGGIDVQVDLV